MDKKLRWIAIGDSFTYLNDHLDETGYRVTKGYLDRVLDKVPGLELFNMGINGSTTETWQAVNIPKADLYTILLGTNDWYHQIPLGTAADFTNKKQGTILGNLAATIGQIKRKAPEAKIIVMNPVERGDFVYIADYWNNAPGSYAPINGLWLHEVSQAIYENCSTLADVKAVNLHDSCGFTVENVVKFKHVRTPEGYQDLAWPAYHSYGFDPEHDEYPYPVECIDRTYDALHPSDEGNETIAAILAEAICAVLQ